MDVDLVFGIVGAGVMFGAWGISGWFDRPVKREETWTVAELLEREG